MKLHRKLTLAGVLFSVVLNASGQVLFKTAAISQLDGSLSSLFLKLETWTGLLLYGLSAVSWLVVLSRESLSVAYPMLALTFPIVVGASALLFSEPILPVRWIGVAIIVLGVSLLART